MAIATCLPPAATVFVALTAVASSACATHYGAHRYPPPPSDRVYRVDARAFDIGYRSGYDDGIRDARRRRPVDYARHGDYTAVTAATAATGIPTSIAGRSVTASSRATTTATATTPGGGGTIGATAAIEDMTTPLRLGTMGATAIQTSDGVATFGRRLLTTATATATRRGATTRETGTDSIPSAHRGIGPAIPGTIAATVHETTTNETTGRPSRMAMRRAIDQSGGGRAALEQPSPRGPLRPGGWATRPDLARSRTHLRVTNGRPGVTNSGGAAPRA